MALYSFVILVSLIFVSVDATNNWTKPCFNGECEYSLPSHVPASGSLKIWGSADALSDITPAAGWEILDCSPDGLEQEIRLVCSHNSTDSANCDHLYQNDGPVGKIVRLPENCGQNAFARVARAWDPEDQSLPSVVAARVVRRDGTTPPVKALALDINFAATNSSKTGTVNFAIVGANIPGADIDLSSLSAGLSSRDTSDFVRNGLFSIGGLLNNHVSFDKSFDIPVDVDQTFNLLNESISCPSIDASLNINVAAKAHALATLGVSASGTLLPIPKIDDFGITANLDATLNGAIDIVADVTGTLDSGRIVLLQPIPIGGIQFPGIFSIGPTFEIDAQAKAKLDVNLDLNVGVVYNISQAQFTFPPTDGNAPGSGSFNTGDTPLKLSVGTAINATGTIEAHLIPRLNLGLSAFTAKANVFLELDASATLDLELDGTAEANATIGDGLTSTDASSATLTTSELASTTASVAAGTVSVSAAESNSTTESDSQLSSVNVTSLDTPTPSSALTIPTSSADNATDTSIPTLSIGATSVSETASTLNRKRRSRPTSIAEAVYAARSAELSDTPSPTSINDLSVSTDTNGNVGGCFSVNSELDVNIGAEGNFFGIIKDGVSVTLFNTNFELFKKCFGSRADETATFRRSLGDRVVASRSVLDLLCPANDLSGATSIADEDVSASSIQAVSS
ncbi:hypothetical protein EV421DRAFT_1804652 [Armillaria borealis]|uniref:Uncharacterized protein n=1 Tax=Armillaria borealis TaxID=47425 RepID=A0AA39MR48_9AGAR|nr:hypothetical protein EV421DRAFT_1804652 [Armillaria borealis]